MGNGPSDLGPEHRLKLDLLKDHFKGVFMVVKELRRFGYVPDRLGSEELAIAVDKLYAEIERGGTE
jgi:hypothetical protein